MSVSPRLKNQHLLWRAAFGPMAENIADLEGINSKKLWELLLKTSAKKPDKIEVAQNLADGLYKGVQDIAKMEAAERRINQKIIQDQSREDLKNLNIRWLDEMINSEAQLREKMSLFWHGHFACRVVNSYFQQELLQVIRENALGNFGDLLRAVSKSPAMISFLNNQQNRKRKPNENFAREVMELFTMGRGHYTEQDIKEAARAFTGWGFNVSGEFEFRINQHDTDTKTVLGKTGNFDGDAILDLLLAQKQTAKYICSKIYRFFVNEQIDEVKVNWLADRFFVNNYDIKKLLEDIFSANWFYEEKNIGTQIKSPIQLLVGIRRLLPMEMDNDQSQLLLQKILGQILFFPPNVAGWPGGRNWIDSSSLMLRLRLPQLITANEIVELRPKADDDTQMGMMEMAKKIKSAVKGGTATIDWTLLNKTVATVPREQLLNKLKEMVLQAKMSVPNSIIEKYLNKESRENYIKSTVVNLLSTPEYQLC
ncbi:MAG: DUF1800 domain-containing protein [Ferruginibacter sp.]